MGGDAVTDLDPGRAARAAEALSEGRATIRRVDADTLEVDSFTGDGTYTVTLDPPGCDCPDSLFRGVRCKHVLAARLRGLT